MSLDIRAGDLLVYGGQEYPIYLCGVWDHERGSTIGFKRMCSLSGSTKRPPAVVSGKRGDPATQEPSIRFMPLDPLSGQKRAMILRENPAAPTDLLETIVDGGDTFYALVLERERTK